MKLYWKIIVIVLIVLVAGTYFYRPHEEIRKYIYKENAEKLQEVFAKVADNCSKAVVVVKTGKKVYTRGYDREYNRLYNYFNYGKVPNDETIPTGLGSGFFVSDDGYILTNFHIVRGQDVFRVELENHKEYSADLVGVDPLSDLAVLKISSVFNEKFPCLEFADSEKVKVGHWAIAIGAPFSLAHTVTVGIVSHKRRSMGMNVYENFIQTDASINRGNSGGPLLDLEGRVIGVNDFILSPSSGNIGLSFSIASNLAKRVCRKIIRDGRVIRPWLGVSMAPVSSREKELLNLKNGVKITGLVNGGPAHNSDMRAGDVVITVDGKKVDSPNDLQLTVFSRNPGDSIKITLLRNNTMMEVKVKAGTMPEIRWR